MELMDTPTEERKIILREATGGEFSMAAVRSELVGRLHRLRCMVSRKVTGMKGDGGNPADVIDHAYIEEYRRVELAIRDRERETIQDIETAIARIDSGDFGICEDCGAFISPGRLLAKPTTTHCRECQEEDERTLRFHKQVRIALFRAA